MRCTLISFAMILTIGVGSAVAQSPEWSAVNIRVGAFYTALAQRDMEGVVNSFHPEAVLALTTDVIAAGRPEIERVLREVWAQNRASTSFTRHTIRLVSPTMAVAHGNISTPFVEGHVMITLVKEDDQWLIATLQTATEPGGVRLLPMGPIAEVHAPRRLIGLRIAVIRTNLNKKSAVRVGRGQFPAVGGRHKPIHHWPRAFLHRRRACQSYLASS